MTNSWNPWPAPVAGFLLLMGLAMSSCAQSNPDRPMSSDDIASSQQRIVEGVVGTVTLTDGSPLMGP